MRAGMGWMGWMGWMGMVEWDRVAARTGIGRGSGRDEGGDEGRVPSGKRRSTALGREQACKKDKKKPW
jgi:hypothetical protein